MALTTYRSFFRLAARPYALSNAFGGAGRKQFATIGHAATAKLWKRLRHIWVAIESASAAGIVQVDLIRLTDNAAAGGNPAIVPARVLGSEAAAEATCLALPTTPGTEDAAPWSGTEWNLGITAAGSVQNPPPPLIWVDLMELIGIGTSPSMADYEGDRRIPQMRPGVAEGWAVTLDASAALTAKALIIIEHSEE
jgi:hypothetical protein